MRQTHRFTPRSLLFLSSSHAHTCMLLYVPAFRNPLVPSVHEARESCSHSCTLGCISSLVPDTTTFQLFTLLTHWLCSYVTAAGIALKIVQCYPCPPGLFVNRGFSIVSRTRSGFLFLVMAVFQWLSTTVSSRIHMPHYPSHNPVYKLSMNLDTFRSCAKTHLQAVSWPPENTDSFVNVDNRSRPISPDQFVSDTPPTHLFLSYGTSTAASSTLYDMSDVVGRFDGAPTCPMSSDSCSSNSEYPFGTPLPTGNTIPGFLPSESFTNCEGRFSSASSTWSSPVVLSSLVSLFFPVYRAKPINDP